LGRGVQANTFLAELRQKNLLSTIDQKWPYGSLSLNGCATET
jgi:hypothetical protein